LFSSRTSDVCGSLARRQDFTKLRGCTEAKSEGQIGDQTLSFLYDRGSTSSNSENLLAPEIARGSPERQELCRKTVKTLPNNNLLKHAYTLEAQSASNESPYDDVGILEQRPRQHVQISGYAIHSWNEVSIQISGTGTPTIAC
jgi:hypothetical protein